MYRWLFYLDADVIPKPEHKTIAGNHVKSLTYVYICIYQSMEEKTPLKHAETIFCMYVCMYVWIYVCMYVCMYVCTYVSMYVSMYVGVYTCMHYIKKRCPFSYQYNGFMVAGVIG